MTTYRNIAIFVDEARTSHREILQGLYHSVRPRLPWGFCMCQEKSSLEKPQSLHLFDAVAGFLSGDLRSLLGRELPDLPVVDLEHPDRAPCVIDWRATGNLMAELLQSKGFSQIFLVGGAKPGFLSGLREVFSGEDGVGVFDPQKHYPPVSLPEGVVPDFNLRLYSFLRSLPEPAAVVTASARDGLQVAEICRRSRIRVPDQISIAAAVDGPRCQMAFPSVSAVEQPWRAMGEEVGQLLEAWLERGQVPDTQRRLLPRRVIERQSTDLLAVPDPHLRKALRLIREEACQGIGVERILAEVPRPRRWLERHFREELGRSMFQEIMRVRIKNARELLLNGSQSTEAIAEACGFGSLTRFSLAFKKHTGVAPGTFRKRGR